MPAMFSPFIHYQVICSYPRPQRGWFITTNCTYGFLSIELFACKLYWIWINLYNKMFTISIHVLSISNVIKTSIFKLRTLSFSREQSRMQHISHCSSTSESVSSLKLFAKRSSKLLKLLRKSFLIMLCLKFQSTLFGRIRE